MGRRRAAIGGMIPHLFALRRRCFDLGARVFAPLNAFVALLLVCAALLAAWPSAGFARASEGCRHDTVYLRGPFGTARFGVELATTEAERARGLMMRESLPKSAGMLFVYPRDTHAVFWMKNTLIALDMIFLDARGVVKSVHSNAIPHDLTPIDGGRGIRAVLEINGGMARTLGIEAGAQMRHPSFAAGQAIWPCEMVD